MLSCALMADDLSHAVVRARFVKLTDGTCWWLCTCPDCDEFHARTMPGLLVEGGRSRSAGLKLRGGGPFASMEEAEIGFREEVK